MLILNTFWEYNLWIIIITVVFTFFSSLLLYICSTNLWSIIFTFKIFSSQMYDYSLSLYFDYMSVLFSMTVCFITINVLFFANYYINFTINASYFLFLTILFVSSILLLINISDIFILILGWDGLGIISFLLVVYYADSNSIFSGLFTLLVNRLGDSFIILAIVLCLSSLPSTFPFSLAYSSQASIIIMLFIFLLGSITNSAIFPFSSWLPAAIAAPTPISALVHSSTLVTAGLFLIIRFSSILSFSPSLNLVMLCLGLYTSLYAGLNALLENDLNNLVALSTLSHLGFICVALFSGSLYLSFLHLLSHALFKSLLFISVGEIIVIHSHSQDSRHITFNSNSGLHSSLFIVFSIFNLCGLPFFSGYYSNDLILEITLYSNFSWLLIIIIYVNVFLTFYYTISIFKSLFNYSNSPSFIMFNIQSPTSSLFISLLGFSGLVVSSAIFWLSPISALYYVNPTLNFLPFLILFLILSLALASNLNLYRFAILSFFGVHSIVYLTSFLSNFNSLFFYIVSSNIFKSFENGVVDNVSNVFLSNLSLSVSNIMYVFISNFTTIFLTYFFILYLFIALVLGNL